MSNLTQTTEIKASKVPVDGTFLWRNGTWLVQAGTMSGCRPVAKGVATLLDQLKAEGQLQEFAPGLYALAGNVAKPVVDSAESPLFKLAHLRQPDGTVAIDVEQFRAGERLRQDYERAHFGQRVTMNYNLNAKSLREASQFSDNHISKLSDAAMLAREQTHNALEAVGPELSGILLHVCCLAGGLEQAELRLNLPKRSARAVLQLALSRLARHYGFKPRMKHGGPAKIGHWAIADFKPQIQPPALRPL
jgi:hypothetical protein